MTQRAIPCTVMRGGTSKGLYFLSRDLPADTTLRDRVLLAAMGSPDEKQIDGMGGAHPLTSKAAVVGPASRDDADVEYLFLQVVVDEARVSDSQNCGNILAGVAQFAIDTGLVEAGDGMTAVRIHMLNSDSIAVARVETPGRVPRYDGGARIDGVPGTAAPVELDFREVAGSNCGALLPTGNARDVADGVHVTCIDNGMPVVLLAAADLGKTGRETPADLEADDALKRRLEGMRLDLGPRMNLGEVRDKTVPKMCLVSAPTAGGVIATRTFIPHRVHRSIGVLGAASVAAACAIPNSVAGGLARLDREHAGTMDIEHPTGRLTVGIALEAKSGGFEVTRTSLLRTARKLFAGEVYVPMTTWPVDAAAGTADGRDPC